MNILIIGSGAREHAIAWRLADSPRVGQVFIVPGNAGTAAIGRNVLPDSGNRTDITGLAQLVESLNIGLTVVGPEAPLASGIVDVFRRRGLPIFGPTKAGAQLESSKAFANKLMGKYHIPSPKFKVFSDHSEAREFLSGHDGPVVIKADGLAAGKGVMVCMEKEEALRGLHECMEARAFGAAGDTVVIEEYLEGPEVSVFALSDGVELSPLVAACDYKRLLDGDAGPNTGGMGSYSPPEFWTPQLSARIADEIMVPTVRAMREEGTPYQGVLYAGLMITALGPRVLEFNCRFGDPEAQVILPLLKTDPMDALMACVEGHINASPIEWANDSSVGIVMASGGYPGEYAKGLPISGLGEVDAGVLVFHAATSKAGDGEDAQVITDGGRVLTVVGTGGTIEQARTKAYNNIGRVRFPGAHYRKDIALRAVPRIPDQSPAVQSRPVTR